MSYKKIFISFIILFLCFFSYEINVYADEKLYELNLLPENGEKTNTIFIQNSNEYLNVYDNLNNKNNKFSNITTIGIDVPIRSGYAFDGYYIKNNNLQFINQEGYFEDDNILDFISSNPNNRYINVSAKYKRLNYNINLKANNKIFRKLYFSSLNDKYIYSSSSVLINKIDIPECEDENYEFAGYYVGKVKVIDKTGKIILKTDSKTGIEKAVIKSAINDTKTVSLEAKWKEAELDEEDEEYDDEYDEEIEDDEEFDDYFDEDEDEYYEDGYGYSYDDYDAYTDEEDEEYDNYLDDSYFMDEEIEDDEAYNDYTDLDDEDNTESVDLDEEDLNYYEEDSVMEYEDEDGNVEEITCSENQEYDSSEEECICKNGYEENIDDKGNITCEKETTDSEEIDDEDESDDLEDEEDDDECKTGFTLDATTNTCKECVNVDSDGECLNTCKLGEAIDDTVEGSETCKECEDEDEDGYCDDLEADDEDESDDLEETDDEDESDDIEVTDDEETEIDDPNSNIYAVCYMEKNTIKKGNTQDFSYEVKKNTKKYRISFKSKSNKIRVKNRRITAKKPGEAGVYIIATDSNGKEVDKRRCRVFVYDDNISDNTKKAIAKNKLAEKAYDESRGEKALVYDNTGIKDTKSNSTKLKSINCNTTTLTVNKAGKVSYTLNPILANNTIKTTTNSKKITIVDSSKAKIKGTKTGDAKVTIKSGNISKKCNVKIKVDTKSPENKPVNNSKKNFNKLNNSGNKNITLVVGNNYLLKYTLEPLSAKKSVSFVSNNSDIAKVNNNGNVTAKKVGTTTIKAIFTSKSGSSKKLIYNITVTNKKSSSKKNTTKTNKQTKTKKKYICIIKNPHGSTKDDRINLVIGGETKKLNDNCNHDVDIKSKSFEAKDDKVTVNSNGRVTAVKKGKTYVKEHIKFIDGTTLSLKFYIKVSEKNKSTKSSTSTPSTTPSAPAASAAPVSYSITCSKNNNGTVNCNASPSPNGHPNRSWSSPNTQAVSWSNTTNGIFKCEKNKDVTIIFSDGAGGSGKTTYSCKK